jgi:hypothetical protein
MSPDCGSDIHRTRSKPEKGPVTGPPNVRLTRTSTTWLGFVASALGARQRAEGAQVREARCT